MSREIKFRAWDHEDCKMIPLSGMQVFDNGIGFFNEDPAFHNDDLSPHIMEFTGLRDSEGREIYEGDILKMNGGADDSYGVVGCEFATIFANTI